MRHTVNYVLHVPTLLAASPASYCGNMSTGNVSAIVFVVEVVIIGQIGEKVPFVGAGVCCLRLALPTAAGVFCFAFFLYSEGN